MGANDTPNTDKPDEKKPVDATPEEEREEEFEGFLDDDAPTVIMQKAIDPSIFSNNEKKPDAEETHIIHTTDPNVKQMSEEELNRIVDEVGRFGAIPMDRLPSEVDKSDAGDDEDKK